MLFGIYGDPAETMRLAFVPGRRGSRWISVGARPAGYHRRLESPFAPNIYARISTIIERPNNLESRSLQVLLDSAAQLSKATWQLVGVTRREMIGTASLVTRMDA
jgi:hypothetical protein